jgi:hypothetical protein
VECGGLPPVLAAPASLDLLRACAVGSRLGAASSTQKQREQAPALHMGCARRDASLVAFCTLFGRQILARAPVVFDFNPCYYVYAFVALVSLLTRLTRLPGEGVRRPFFWRAGQAGAQIAF